jgi:hypothetical protein
MENESAKAQAGQTNKTRAMTAALIAVRALYLSSCDIPRIIPEIADECNVSGHQKKLPERDKSLMKASWTIMVSANNVQE